jgi:hypothetical protein
VAPALIVGNCCHSFAEPNHRGYCMDNTVVFKYQHKSYCQYVSPVCSMFCLFKCCLAAFKLII